MEKKNEIDFEILLLNIKFNLKNKSSTLILEIKDDVKSIYKSSPIILVDNFAELKKTSLRVTKELIEFILIINDISESFFINMSNYFSKEISEANNALKKINLGESVLEIQVVTKEKIYPKISNLLSIFDKKKLNEQTDQTPPPLKKIVVDKQTKIQEIAMNIQQNITQMSSIQSQSPIQKNLGSKYKSKPILKAFQDSSPVFRRSTQMTCSLPKNLIQCKSQQYESKKTYTHINSVFNKFCECFFIVGVDISAPSRIDEEINLIQIKNKEYKNQETQYSRILSSTCNHILCSSREEVFKPNILTSFSFNDNEFQVNDLLANLCFPVGIKLCYDNEDKIPSIPATMLFTPKLDGSKYYIISMIVYQKVELSKVLGGNKEGNVYMPAAFCLVSKFPFAKQMTNCLFSIIRIITIIDFTKKEKTDRLKFFHRSDNRIYKIDTMRMNYKNKQKQNSKSKIDEESIDDLNSFDEDYNGDLFSRTFFKGILSKHSFNLNRMSSLLEENIDPLEPKNKFSKLNIRSLSSVDSGIEDVELSKRDLLNEKLSTINGFHSILIYLLAEINIPLSTINDCGVNDRLFFYIPFQNTPIEVSAPIYKGLPITNYNISLLLDILTNDCILNVFNLILLEKKIVFVKGAFDLSHNPTLRGWNILSRVVEAFINLIYPIQWSNIVVPVVSQDILSYLQSPIAFIMGIDESMIPMCEEHLSNMSKDDEIYFVYLTNSVISKTLSNEICSKQYEIYYYDDYTVNKSSETYKAMSSTNKLPSNTIYFLNGKLKDIRDLIESKKSKENKDIKDSDFYHDRKIRKYFTIAMANLLGDYQNYLSFVDDLPLFNEESYLQTKKSTGFYREFIDTQGFNYFLQFSDIKYFPYFHKKNQINCKFYTGIVERESRIRKDSINKTKSKTLRPDSPKSFIEEAEKNELIYKDNYLIVPSFIPDLCFEEFKEDLSQEKIVAFNEKLKPHTSNKLILSENIIQMLDLDVLTSKLLGNEIGINDYQINLPDTYNESENKEHEHNLENLDKKKSNYTMKSDYSDLGKYVSNGHLKNEFQLFVENNPYLNKESKERNSSFIPNISNTDQKENKEERERMNSINETRKYTIITRNRGKAMNQINENQYKELEEFTINIMKSILTSKPLTIKAKSTLTNFFKIKNSIEMFTGVVFLKKFVDINSQQCLSNISFNELVDIFYLALIHGEESYITDLNLLDHLMLLTEVMFMYYTEHSKQRKYIYQEITKKKCMRFWLDSQFWEYWLLFLLNESNYQEELESVKLNHIIFLMNKMFLLELPTGNIKVILIKDLGERYLDQSGSLKIEQIIKKRKLLLVS